MSSSWVFKAHFVIHIATKFYPTFTSFRRIKDIVFNKKGLRLATLSNSKVRSWMWLSRFSAVEVFTNFLSGWLIEILDNNWNDGQQRSSIYRKTAFQVTVILKREYIDLQPGQKSTHLIHLVTPEEFNTNCRSSGFVSGQESQFGNMSSTIFISNGKS